MAFAVFYPVIFNKEILAALIGGSLALLYPSASRSKRQSVFCGRRSFSLPPCWRAAFLACFLGGLCVHGAKELVQKEFSVQLHRQEIPLHNKGGVVHHKSAYYGSIQVGSPEVQTFDVVFDTGSGHLVLPSTMCRSETCKVHRRYRRKMSHTADDIDVDGSVVKPGAPRDQITVSFGTGEITGVFIEDQVCLGAEAPLPEGFNLLQAYHQSLTQHSLLQKVQVGDAANRTNGTLERASAIVSEDPIEDEHEAVAEPKELSQAAKMRSFSKEHRRKGCLDLQLIASTEMSEEPFASFTFDGILGLGLTELSQTPEFNFLDVLPGGLNDAQPMFAVFLAVSDLEESQITFGAWRPEHLLHPADDLKWAVVVGAEYGYWQIPVFAIYANGIKTDICNEGCRAIVDTGTSLIGVPSSVGKELRKMLRHPAREEDGACGLPGPQLEFDLGNITLVLDPLDIARPEFLTRKRSSLNSSLIEGNSSTGSGNTTSSGNNLLQEESWHKYVDDYSYDDEDDYESASGHSAMTLLETTSEMLTGAAVEADKAAKVEMCTGVDCNATASTGLRTESSLNATSNDTQLLNKTVLGNESSGAPAPPPPPRCVPMLMHLDLPEPLMPMTFILGEPMLQKYYTAFDRGNLRIGFAEAKHVKPREMRKPKIVDE